MRFATFLFLLPLFAVCFDFDGDNLPLDHKRANLLKNIPVIIKRSYAEWSSESSCIDQILRSTRAIVKSKKSQWHTYSVRIPRRVGPVIHAQLLLEYHRISNTTQVGDYDYSIAILSKDRSIKPRRRKASQVVVNDNLVELFFNITSIYHRAKIMGHRKIRLRVRLLVSGDDPLQESAVPFSYKVMKSFLITHEDNKNCSSHIADIAWHGKRFVQVAKRKVMLKTFEKPSLYPVNDNPIHPCKLVSWYVPFHTIGWNSFVIAPSGIDARACSGACGFPLMSNSTEHALLQTAVSLSNGQKSSVCCVPTATGSATLVLYDDLNESVYIIKYPNLIAQSCGCL